jgi:hypothetical protein
MQEGLLSDSTNAGPMAAAGVGVAARHARAIVARYDGCDAEVLWHGAHGAGVTSSGPGAEHGAGRRFGRGKARQGDKRSGLV